MKFRYLLISILCTAIACRPVKKVQSITTVIKKADTVQPIVIKNLPKVDSMAIIDSIVNKVNLNKIVYNSFNAKIKAQYNSKNETQDLTAYVSILKDSIIYIKIKAVVVGIPVLAFQIMITKDSVAIVHMVKDKHIQKRSINYLTEATQIPFDYYTLQDLLVGNPIFLKGSIVSFKKNDNHQLMVNILGKFFKNLITLNDQYNLVFHSKLDDVNPLRNRTCDITYNNHQLINNFQFPTFTHISVSEKFKVDVDLDYKNYDFNEPLKYSFELPKNFKIR